MPIARTIALATLCFTAAITTSLTVDELSGKVRGLADLPGVRVGSVAESGAMRFLGERGIAARPFANEEDGLRAIVDGEIDALVFDELALRYLVKTVFPDQVRVLPRSFDHYRMKLALPAGSPLREPVNRALLKIIESPDWSRRGERYIGPDH